MTRLITSSHGDSLMVKSEALPAKSMFRASVKPSKVIPVISKLEKKLSHSPYPCRRFGSGSSRMFSFSD